MRTITTDELQKAIEAHKKWLECDPDGERLRLMYSNVSNSDLRDCNLSGCELRCCNLSDCDLRGCDLSNSDLRDCNLSGCELKGCNLSGCELKGCNLSESTGLKSQTDFMAENFERTADGYIAYKRFGWCFDVPPQWSIEPGSVLEEVVNYDRTYPCGCGINVASLAWAEENIACDPAWKVLIRWEWLPGVCVPYNSDGRIRCEKVELIEEIQW